ncbi:MAG: radical SAM family heme chaperone HemW [Bacilli bacterium]|nr:radical SAM family heme chaperone HemW [Bacilli bacterium]
MSVYIHIPFCNKICSYCDFPKMLKNEKWIDDYLNELEKEIKENYKGEIIETLYIGGGTPSSLNIKELRKLFKIIKIFNIKNNAEITIEANSEDLTNEKLKLLSKHTNRLSIGIETFNKKTLKELNRKVNVKNIANAFKYFKNINLDLMYGFKNQTLEDLKEDLNKIIELNPTHISAYSLIIEPNTKFYINNYQNIDEDEDLKMYNYIKQTLNENGYIHYEISNFAKKEYQSKHNLTYWNNENYYGFGLGASGYQNDIRYENTRSLNKYLEGEHRKESHKLDKSETIQNEFMLGFRKIEGINKNKFKNKFNIDINSVKEIEKLKEKKLLLENKNNIFINPKYLYISNEILINLIDFTLLEQ